MLTMPMQIIGFGKMIGYTHENDVAYMNVILYELLTICYTMAIYNPHFVCHFTYDIIDTVPI